MIPRLGDLFDIDINVISKSRDDYQSLAYEELGLPKAPAIMIGSKVFVAGTDIEEEKLLSEIRKRFQQG